jgi:hypothetical protein
MLKLRGSNMSKNDTVALMAATIFAARPPGRTTTDAEAMYGSVAAQAWALYEAVEKKAVQRLSSP